MAGDVSRRNGAKSKGPKTERGKAIVSQNGRKHGLLSRRPPLLLSEGVEEFRALMGQLDEHYKPQSPVECHLVEQIAMAMLKQYRVWDAEVAVHEANLKEGLSISLEPTQALSQSEQKEYSLMAELRSVLPSVEHLPLESEYSGQREKMSERALLTERKDAEENDWLDCWPPLWAEEIRDILEESQPTVNSVYRRFPEDLLPPIMRANSLPHQPSQAAIEDWQCAMRKLCASGHVYPILSQVAHSFETLDGHLNNSGYRFIAREPRGSLEASVKKDAKRIVEQWQDGESYLTLDCAADSARYWMLELVKAVEKRTASYDSKVEVFAEQDKQRAEIAQLKARCLPESFQLISRYESHVNRQLHGALTKLHKLQFDRGGGVS